MKRFMLKHRLCGWLKAGKSSALAAACAATTATAAMPPPVPPCIRSLMSDGDTLLAFRETPNLFGDGDLGAVAAIRHKPDRGDSWENNPCDLVVLRKQGNQWNEQARSNQVIDCVDSDIYPFTQSFEADDNLTVTPKRIAFTNERAIGHKRFEFRFEAESSEWVLTAVKHIRTDFNHLMEEVVIQSSISERDQETRTTMSGMKHPSIDLILRSREMESTAL